MWDIVSTVLFGPALGWWHKRRVYRWLQENTADDANHLYATTTEIANGVGLPESRIKNVCTIDKRIHPIPDHPELWSIHTDQFRSVYEERGILHL
jgi:hypothetical protein